MIRLESETDRVTAFADSIVAAGALLFVLVAFATWPQILYLGSKVPDHQDPLLSMWRLGWIAHALSNSGQHLFDGNIFYPHALTLAYSDATLLEGVLAAPWLWAQANPVLVYNVLLYIGIVSSGLGMFVLVRYLTNNSDAALVSAAIFTIAPYRIEHFMHLELQWTAWMPLTFWAVHRVFDEAKWRHGMLAGILLTFQLLSSIYYGVYLGIIVTALTVLLAVCRPERLKVVVVPLIVAPILPVAVALVFGQPYLQNALVLGPRDPGDIATFSARLSSYFTAPEPNWLWGWTSVRFRGNELRVLPGMFAVALAIWGVVRRPRNRTLWIYIVVTTLAIALSLGMNGSLYRWLHEHVWALQGFRAPARFAVLALCGIAVLAGFGFDAVRQCVASPRALLIAVLVAVSIECASSPMDLSEVPRQSPDIYKVLKASDRSVVIELPFVDWDLTPLYMYWSTQHWQPLVNGYSGYTPSDYEITRDRMRTFPDDDSIEHLRQLNVRFVVVHEYFYKPAELTGIMLKLARRRDLVPAGRYRDWVGNAQLFELTPANDPSTASKNSATCEAVAAGEMPGMV